MNYQNSNVLLDDISPKAEKGKLTDIKSFDYVFIGLGAGNSLMLLAFIKEGLLFGKSVAVIDSSLKNENDKTYCFWAAKNSEIVQHLKPIISYTYTKLTIDNGTPESIEDEQYFYIKSINLYKHLQQELKKHSITFYHTKVSEIISKNEKHKIVTKDDSFIANYVFDSRPPKLLSSHPKDIFLLQSFYGLHVKFNINVFKADTFDMMNFEVEQNNYTQFIYTLPFSKNEALIEFTRFGVDTIEPSYGKKILQEYINIFKANYDIIAEEIGCIPMTTIKIPKNPVKGIINTGARANLIKPSTGYGFKNMYNFAAATTANIKNNGLTNFDLTVYKKKKRFQFYDHLLLIILYRWPYLGKPIFKSLFKKQGAKKVLAFLDEQTTIFKEIRIFLFLPLKPFLKALSIYLYHTIYLRIFLVVSVIAVYHILNFFDSNLAVPTAYLFFVTGMLLVGIPHGAVDHLLEFKKQTNLYKFIIKYISIVLVYFLFWHFFPLLAIVLFIIYSAFHFGESELRQIGKSLNSVKNFLASFILGLTILFFIMATHLQATVNLIAEINGLEFILSHNQNLILYQTPSVLILSALLVGFALYFNKSSLYVLLIILLLGTTIPLLFAFGLYFICQHSVNAWQHILNEMDIKNKALLKKAFPFSLAAILLFVCFAVLTFFYDTHSLKILNSLFFIFLACISLPHVVLMHKFYNNVNINQTI